MHINSLAICLIIYPVSFVDVSINVGEFTMAMGSVIFPCTFITSTIRPNLFTLSISESSDPFSCVGGTCSIGVGRSDFSLGVRVVGCVSDCLFQFNRCKVATVCPFGLLQNLHSLSGCIASPDRLKSDYQVSVLLKSIQVGSSN